MEGMAEWIGDQMVGTHLFEQQVQDSARLQAMIKQQCGAL